MKVWATEKELREEVASVPRGWLRAWGVRHTTDRRKFEAANNGKMLYRVDAVLRSIEDGEGMPNDGIVEVPFAVANPPVGSGEHFTPQTMVRAVEGM